MSTQSEHSAPDLVILVREDRRGGTTRLSFVLKARDPGLGLNYEEFGPKELRADPWSFLRNQLQDVDDRISLGDDKARADALRHLENKGASLTEALLPDDLQDRLRALRDKVTTVQVQAEDGWIPWELLRLRGRENGRRQLGPFFCKAFALTRWRPGLPEHLQLPLGRLAFVSPEVDDLPSADAEREALEELFSPPRTFCRVPAVCTGVLEEMARGSFEGWHFTGHGAARTPDPDRWSIALDDGELRPEDLAGEAANLGAARPLVFLNACHTGKSALSLTQVGGWAASFLNAGAGAFLGALWATRDEPAKELARAFYSHFLAGVPLGESLRRARLEIRDAFPGDPTWLAYAVYAHPLASIAEGVSIDRPQPPATVPPPSESSAVGASPRACPPRVARRGESSPRRRRLAVTAVCVVLGLVTFATLHLVKTPTRVRLDLEVSRLVVTVEASDPLFLTALAFDHLTVSRFATVELHPSELAAPVEGRWKPVSFRSPVRLVARGAAQVTLTSTDPAVQSPIGSIGRLRLRDRDRVELGAQKSGDDVDLRIRLPMRDPLSVSMGGAFELVAEEVDVGDLAGSHLRVDLSRGLDVFPGTTGLILTATLPPELGTLSLLEGDLPVSGLQLTEEGAGSSLASALQGPGDLKYPDQPLYRFR